MQILRKIPLLKQRSNDQICTLRNMEKSNKEKTDDMLGVKIFHRKKRNACRCSEPMPWYFYNLPGFYVCVFWEVLTNKQNRMWQYCEFRK